MTEFFANLIEVNCFLVIEEVAQFQFLFQRTPTTTPLLLSPAHTMLSAERPHRDYELPVRRRRVSMLKRMSISAAPAASVSAAAVNAPASVAAAPRSAFNNIMDEDAGRLC